VSRDLPTVYVRGYFSAPTIAAADYPAMYVGMSILQSRLFQEVRIKRNLSYAPGASVAQRMTNFGSLYVSTPNPNAAIKVIQDEVRKMQTSVLSQDEVRDAALAARTRLLQNLEASADIADIVGRFTLATGDPQSFDTFLARITTVTPGEVQQAMDKYAHRVDFALLGNVKDVDQSLLTSF